MENLLGLLIFIVFGIIAAANKYKESQQNKNLKPPPPKPRQAPRREDLPEATRRLFERREVRTARPAGPREARRPAPPVQRTPQIPPTMQHAPTRPAQPRPTMQRVPQRPPQTRPAAERPPQPPERPQVAPWMPRPAIEEEPEPPQRRRREQRRTPQEQARKPKPTLEQMNATPAQRRAGRQAARERLRGAVEQEAQEETAEMPVVCGERRAVQLPPLFRNMEGIREGIIFSEIINPPLALR